jgi:hypothetical protein
MDNLLEKWNFSFNLKPDFTPLNPTPRLLQLIEFTLNILMRYLKPKKIGSID